MEHLKKVITSCVRDEFGFKPVRVQIKPDYDHDGDAIWLVHIWLDNGDKKIKKGDTYYLAGAVSRAIWDEQRDDSAARTPIVLTHYAKRLREQAA